MWHTLNALDRASLSYNTGGRNFPMLSLFSGLAFILYKVSCDLSPTLLPLPGAIKIVKNCWCGASGFRHFRTIYHTFSGAAIDLAQLNPSMLNNATKGCWEVKIRKQSYNSSSKSSSVTEWTCIRRSLLSDDTLFANVLIILLSDWYGFSLHYFTILQVKFMHFIHTS